MFRAIFHYALTLHPQNHKKKYYQTFPDCLLMPFVIGSKMSCRSILIENVVWYHDNMKLTLEKKIFQFYSKAQTEQNMLFGADVLFIYPKHKNTFW